MDFIDRLDGKANIFWGYMSQSANEMLEFIEKRS
jgi:hypothetical protein